MSFFESIRKFKHQLDQVESNVYSGKQSLLEVYELNAKLEAEIAHRTQELDRANRQMLTLQHIWDMMNSSKPLSSVLNAIVNSLRGELGYLYSFIVKEKNDNDGRYLQIVASSRDDLDAKFYEKFGENITDLRIHFPNITELKKSVENNKIYQSTAIKNLITGFMPNLDEFKVEEFIKYAQMKSYILVPLMSKQTHFGSLIVFSSRENINASELNFLSLFAKQIELSITIADLFKAVKEQAITDGMTGLYNRRYFEEFIKKEATRAERQSHKFTVIGLDLDHLKQINDKYGHNYGDIAIKTIAEVLKNNARSIDIAARMGGEEFNLLLPGVDSEGGCIAAERIRKAIESVTLEKIGNITASLGVATYLEHSDDIDELLEITDRAMYESKQNGRNRVTVAKPSTETSWQELALSTFIDILSKHRVPVSDMVTEKLTNKLQEMNINNENVYQVADALVSVYNPEHLKGGVKKKVELATLLAKRFDLSKNQIDNLKIAILLYDIGNLVLPSSILRKKEPLTDDDIKSIKQHPVIAAREILQPISKVVDVLPIIEKHHENWNGTGYPSKLSGEDIPIESQIILIVDSYYALLEKRPYRDAMNKMEALDIISDESDKKWSRKLANEFIGIVKSDVEL